MKKEEKKLAEEADKKAEANKAEGKEENKEDFEKEKSQVDVNKYNQALRKSREAEAEKRELEKEKELLKEKVISSKPDKPIVEKKVEAKKEEEDDDDFWTDDGKKKEPVVEKQQIDSDQIQEIINEKIRPFVESESQRNKLERKKARQEFFETHPEYLTDADKWAEVLDELGSSIVPSGDYYQDLEKAHRIIGGETVTQQQIEKQKTDTANDAGTSGGTATPNSQSKDTGLSEMDKKIMEGTGVSADTIKEMRKMEKDGTLKLEF